MSFGKYVAADCAKVIPFSFLFEKGGHHAFNYTYQSR